MAVPLADPRFEDIKELQDLPQHVLKEFKNFLETYKVLQGKTVEIKGFGDRQTALAELEKTRTAHV